MYGSMIRIADQAREFSVGTILTDTSAVPGAAPRAGGTLQPAAQAILEAASEAQSAQQTDDLEVLWRQVAQRANSPTKSTQRKTAPQSGSEKIKKANDPAVRGAA
jgi:hypothetical protein